MTASPPTIARNATAHRGGAGLHLTAAEVKAIHVELRAAGRASQDRLDVPARTDLYAGLASVALLDHLRGGWVSVSLLGSLARHSATAREVQQRHRTANQHRTH